MTWASWSLDPVDHEAHLIVRPDSSVVRASARSAQGRGFESHSGQLSIWNRKTLAQNEYHIYSSDI